MKKLYLLITGVVMIASTSLMAETVAFSYGTNFFSPSTKGFATGNGKTTSLEWTLDTGLTFGVVNEETVLNYTEPASKTQEYGTLTVNGIRLYQRVIDRVRIGIGIGSGVTNMPVSGCVDNSSVVDIIGEITLFSGEGKKLEGSMIATLSSRYMTTDGTVLILTATPINDLNGVNAGISIKIGF